MRVSLAVPRVARRAAVVALAAVALSAGGACSRGESAAREPGPAAATAASDTALRARADQARIRGDSAATVWLVMVSDYQCPYCKMWHDSTFRALDEEYVRTGKVRMAYLNYPLPSHRHARAAADAAMCAGVQGRFWEMHDLLFDTQPEWSARPTADAFFDSLATRAGADAAALRRCVASGVVRPLVQADMDRSAATGISSTPTFVIGDSTIEGAHPVARFRQVLDAALRSAGRP